MCAAFKDPKFVEMFDEYAKAIADPEVGGCGRGRSARVCARVCAWRARANH